MYKKIALIVCKTVTVMILAALIVTPLSARVTFNGSQRAFRTDTFVSTVSIGGVGTATVTLEECIIRGAGYYLASHSDYLWLLNSVELSDLDGADYFRMLKEVDAAVADMEKANRAYRLLKKIADGTPYNQTVINQLLVFDYETFCKERLLNQEIFDQSAKYLRNGDVRGLYAEITEDTEYLLDYLLLIRQSIAARRLPENWDIWRLNQCYSQILLKGQYVAEVFLSLP